MSIRFKFRSSVAFDAVNLAGEPSISVRDLRSRIISQKNLQICSDFDLLISDPQTGQPFEDELLQIPEGSSVIIKRVPADRTNYLDLPTGNFAIESTSAKGNVEKENFDDFGVDLYPGLDGPLVDESDPYDEYLDSTADKMADAVPRCSDTSISRCQNNERSDLSEAMSKEIIGDNCCKESDTDEIKKQTELECRKGMQLKLDKCVGMPLLEKLTMDLPTELRCPLCKAIFKEAVMIPCCQHSFCNKCIRLALAERGRCPRCSSLKCTIQDLLPNLSLQQAIEHFLEAQIENNAPHTIFPEYAPDGESAIHGKDVSCAVSIRQKEPPCPLSSSAIGKGSKKDVIGSAYENNWAGSRDSHILHLKTNIFVESGPSTQKISQVKGDGNGSAEVLKLVQGGNTSKLPQNLLQKEEAIGMPKKMGLCVDTLDGTGAQTSRFRKDTRTCYRCGSPSHLIRDCPAPSNSHPFIQTGDNAFTGGMPSYGQPYWNGASLPHAGPYANMYATPGMMSFDHSMVPVSPFGVPLYMSSMYNGMSHMSVPYGFTRMGGMQPPMMAGVERLDNRTAFLDRQDGEQQQKALKEHLERDYDYDDNYNNETRRRLYERKHQDEETTRSISSDDSQRIYKKHSHDKFYSSNQRPKLPTEERIHSVDRRHEKGSHHPARDQGTRKRQDKEIRGSLSSDDSHRIYKNHPHDKLYSSSHQRPNFPTEENIHSVDRRHEKGSHQPVSGRDQATRKHHNKETTESLSSDDSQRMYKKHPNNKLHISSHQRPKVPTEERFHSIDRRHEKGSHQPVLGRDQGTLKHDKPIYSVQAVSDNSNRISRERAHHQDGNNPKKQIEQRGQCPSDSSQKSHHRSHQREISCDEMDMADHRRQSHRYHDNSKSGFGHAASSDRKHHPKEESRKSSRPSRHMVQSTDEKSTHDRWEMRDDMDNDYREEHYNHKRKRTH